jgi:glycosyltransferase involved in cell wall biosynthesis
MDYMLAACAVLHSVEAGNDPVAESGCGVSVEPESPAAVADGLRRLAALSREERQAMGQRGRNYVLAHHTYPALARRFLAALDGACAHPSHERSLA